MGSLNDFAFGSPGTSSTFYPPPIYPPGWGAANSWWENIFPSLINLQPPQYPGQLDPGMSPTMAAVMRMGQNNAMSPVPDMMGPLYGMLGSYMRPPSTFQPDKGWGPDALSSFAGRNQQGPSASGWGGPAPNFGFSPGAPSFQNPFAPQGGGQPPTIPMQQGPGGAWEAQPQGGTPALMSAFGGGGGGNAGNSGFRSVTGQMKGPFPVGPGSQPYDPRAGHVDPLDQPAPPGNPSEVHKDENGKWQLGPAPGGGPGQTFNPGGGGGGGVPIGSGGGGTAPGAAGAGGNSIPSVLGPGGSGFDLGGLSGMWGSLPPAIQNMLIGSGLNLIAGGGGGGGAGGGGFGGPFGTPNPVSLPAYQGPPTQAGVSHTPSFVNWGPGSDQITMQPGLRAGSSTTFPGVGGAPGGGPTTAPPQPAPGAPPPGGGGGGMPANGVVPGNRLEWFGQWRGPNKGKSMAEIQRDMYERGWDYGPNFQAPAEWGARGSKPTTWEEARMKNPGAGMGGGGPQPMSGGPTLTNDMIPGQPGGGFNLGAGGPSGGGPRSVSSASQASPFAMLQAFNQSQAGGAQGARAPGAPLPGLRSVTGASSTTGPSPGGFAVGSGGMPGAGARPAGGMPPSFAVGGGVPNTGAPPAGGPGAPPPPAGSASGPPSATPAGPFPAPGPGSQMPDFFGAGLNAARDAYLSQVPVMQRDMQNSIGDAMSGAGFSGNRFSSSAMKTAGDIGADAGLRQNALMGSLLGGATERGLDRALQSTGMNLQNDQFYNQMGWQGNENAQDRALRAMGMQPDLMRTQMDLQRQPMLDLFNMGQWEQGRQDMFNLLPFQHWQNNQYGLLPQIMQMIGGVGGPTTQQPTQTNTPGGAGAMDWIALINAFRGMGGGGG